MAWCRSVFGTGKCSAKHIDYKRIQVRENNPGDADTERTVNAVESESEPDFLDFHLLRLRYKPYQYLYYPSNTGLPLNKVFTNLDSQL